MIARGYRSSQIFAELLFRRAHGFSPFQQQLEAEKREAAAQYEAAQREAAQREMLILKLHLELQMTAERIAAFLEIPMKQVTAVLQKDEKPINRRKNKTSK